MSSVKRVVFAVAERRPRFNSKEIVSVVTALVNPFRTAVPFWEQTTQISSSLSRKRDCGSKGVNPRMELYLSVTYT